MFSVHPPFKLLISEVVIREKQILPKQFKIMIGAILRLLVIEIEFGWGGVQTHIRVKPNSVELS